MLDLLENAALLLTLCWLQFYSARLLGDRMAAGQFAHGGIFGLICVICMADPIVIAPGMFIDARLALLGVAGLLGGPVVATVAVLVAGIYRIWIGGAGTFAGLANMLLAVLLGLLFRHLCERGWVTQRAVNLLLFGALIHAGSLIFIDQLRVLSYDEFVRVTVILLTVMPPATLLLALLLKDQQRRAEIEQALVRSEARLSAVTQAIPDQLIVVDAHGNFLELAPPQVQRIGERYCWDSSRRLQDAMPEALAQVLLMWIRDTLSGKDAGTLDYCIESADGERALEARAEPIAAVPFGRRAVMMMVRDITERKRAERQIRRLAFYDSLTELPNRRYLQERLKNAQANCVRSRRHAALLFIDLDNFKNINDFFGHDVGDDVLRQTAVRLCKIVRAADMVARLGGDEFVILLEGLAPDRQEAAAQAGHVGQQVLSVLRQPFQVGQQQPRGSGSIGIVLFSAEHVDSELLGWADMSMYAAKATGKDRLRFFDPGMQDATSARLLLEEQIRQGLQNGEFRIFYQPQFSESSGIFGAEALLRWQHPERGLIGPGEFLNVAVSAGLMPELDRWLLRGVCEQLAQWDRVPALAHVSVSVNICANHLHEADFANRVLGMIRGTGAQASRIKLELTESMLVVDLEQASLHIAMLRQHGVRFALDDFGTGYSSLYYLQQLPLDQLKIDQAFVQRLPETGSVAIIRAITALAHAFGFEIVAEGVESEQQRRFLAANGCPNYQGFLFAKPLPVEELVRLASRSAIRR